MRKVMRRCESKWVGSFYFDRIVGKWKFIDHATTIAGLDRTPQTETELAALRRSVVRGSPFGETSWQERTAKQLGPQSTLHPRGRGGGRSKGK
jgi:hypothetical protein